MKAEDIFNKPLTKRELETLRRTAERQAAGDDSHIDYSDIPPLTDEQLAAMTRFRDARDRLEKKKMISLYVRGDVLEWLKSKGPGHLTRISDILTSVMEAERRVKRRFLDRIERAPDRGTGGAIRWSREELHER